MTMERLYSYNLLEDVMHHVMHRSQPLTMALAQPGGGTLTCALLDSASVLHHLFVAWLFLGTPGRCTEFARNITSA